MAQWLFLDGAAWFLADDKEMGVAALEGGGIALLLFTDEDLAGAYAQDQRTAGKSPRLLQGLPAIWNLMAQAKRAGATHVAVDATPGRQANVTEIEKAMQNVSTE